MPPSLDYSSAAGASPWSTSGGRSSSRGLSDQPTSPLGVLSPTQSHAILCVALAGACFSLLAALISLRWFLLMRRSYRHHLIMFLIVSDAWKSLWYFISPIVVFTSGKVDGSSGFCQASGFFLSLGLETSDFAILMIALHTILYVFKRPQIRGEGGLYPYRKYVYPLWLGLPLLSAGLAFTNPKEGYVTSGTFCYLPKRPIWYRLALAWIPRYLIFITIFLMYAAIWAYVHIKFRGFNDMVNDSSRYASGSASRRLSDRGQSRTNSKALEFDSVHRIGGEERRKASANSHLDQLDNLERQPWEDVSFITSKPLQDARVAQADFAPDAESSLTQVASRHMSTHSVKDQGLRQDPRKASEVPALATDYTSDTATTESSVVLTNSGTKNPVKSTRSQIRRQLRLLFIYPLVYLLMWTFPFAFHCLLYSDYYAAHPPCWLAVLSTASLSLQAGVDCVVFSWRERPWHRIDESSGWTWSNLLFRLVRKQSGRDQSSPSTLVEEQPRKRDSNWWEAEGQKRKDSVWMGTDQLNQILSRKDRDEVAARI